MDLTGHYSVDSEYMPLKAVLLYKPGREIETVDVPEELLYERKIEYDVMDKEYRQIIRLYRDLKINIHLIDSTKINGGDNNYLFNLMYVRDLLFMTPGGAILSRMAYDIRRQEVKYAKKALEKKEVPIKTAIKDNNTFEGADALWVNEKLVVVGTGNRTNKGGFRQVKEELERQGVDCISVSVPEGIQHLLGVLQFIDSDKALVRIDLVGKDIIDVLEQNKIKVVAVHETEEIRSKQAMNFVTIAPRKIIMAAGCPQTKTIYKQAGIEIAAEVEITQLINGGGGLACATGILSRSDRVIF